MQESVETAHLNNANSKTYRELNLYLQIRIQKYSYTSLNSVQVCVLLFIIILLENKLELSAAQRMLAKLLCSKKLSV